MRCFNVSRVCWIDGFTIHNGSSTCGAGIYLDCPPESCGLTGYDISVEIENCTIDLAAPEDDLEGVTRPQDGDGDGIAVSDMGAHELTE